MTKKHDLPAQPFYWGDWFKAMDLQSLPRETRCVWFEMIGRMWESNERGYLTINGKPMSDFAKANSLGFGSCIDDYLKHERILEENGIFSRRKEDGAIYCRKILNDIELSNKRSISGKKGGEKTSVLLKQTSSKIQASAKASALANSEYESEYENESNINKPISKPIDKPISSSLISIKEFNMVWERYPNKDGKKSAERYFKASVKTQDDLNDINKALDNYLKSDKVQKGFIKNGSTWFNNWKDWLSVSNGKSDEIQKLEDMINDFKQR